MDKAKVNGDLKAFHPNVVGKEMSHFTDQVKKYKAGEVADEVFKPFRLQHGIYGQRQQGVQMIRVKVPSGLLNGVQLRGIADLVEKYAPLQIGHVTTRQNFQFHFIQLENVPAAMEILNGVGLSTREACGNSVRNIVGSALSGVCPAEVFDTAPYTMIAFNHFLRHPATQALPRKFKMAFSGCETDDCSQTDINDIGCTAVIKEVNGKKVKGFKFVVGGGLGASPNKPAVLSEFVPVDEFLPLMEATIEYFNQNGERKNRDRARMKFLLRKVGADTFKAGVYKILDSMPSKTQALPPIPDALPVPAGLKDPASIKGDAASENDADYKEWRRLNVRDQKQKGYHVVVAKIFLGDLTVDQFRTLADIAETYGDGSVRTMYDQNMAILWVATAALPKIYSALKAIKLADPGPGRFSDVTSCPGGDSCNLAFTKSRGLGRKLTLHLTETLGVAEDLQGAHVKISGCPNSCGQHHISTIGFFGGVQSTPDKQHIPSYSLLLGGGISPEGVQFGKITMRIPAANCPEAVDRLVALYREQRNPGESMESFVRRVDQKVVKDRLQDLTVIDPKNEKLFMDLGDTEKFKFSGIGTGECAV